MWNDRIKVISGDAQWGYDEGFFDIAISNPVIEHVRDLDRFLENFIHSVSRDGVSIHLFPLVIVFERRIVMSHLPTGFLVLTTGSLG